MRVEERKLSGEGDGGSLEASYAFYNIFIAETLWSQLLSSP